MASFPNDVQNDVLEAGILVVAVRVPAGGNQINFHIARHGLFAFKLQDRAAKIRSALDTHEAGMQHAHGSSIGGFELVALEALMPPDGLQQFFRRRGIAVA